MSIKIEKKIDVICIGRIAVDLYGQQIGSRLEDMSSFSKYLGGSSGNVAYGTAIQGLRSAMLARVGDEHNGRFLREELKSVGCNTEHLIIDKNRLTGLVILGIKDEKTFPLIFYRDNCADMGLVPDDIQEEFIMSAHCIAISGTHLSHSKTRSAIIKALNICKNNQLRTVLDIDYRPVLWGLTSLGDGETRFIKSHKVTKKLQEVLHYFNLIVGTEEEFHIAGGSTDTLIALKNVRKFTHAILVCKRGPLGCAVFENKIPNNWQKSQLYPAIQVKKIINVLGAGDAFMSGLLRGWLNNENWENTCQYANACGAIVVSRHGCAPAMPTKEELDYFLSEKEITKHNVNFHSTINHLHRVTTRKRQWQNLNILAFDHRDYFLDMVHKLNINENYIIKLKILLLKVVQLSLKQLNNNNEIGILVDSTYGEEVLNEITGKGLWIGRPIEMPNSYPLRLEYGNIGSQLIYWPKDHVVKCLVYYHPNDDKSLKKEQDDLLIDLWNSCNKSGHELLLELILPKNNIDIKESYYLDILNHFYSIGIKPDWWKLPPLSPKTWESIGELINKNDHYCRGILLLGLNQSQEKIMQGFYDASKADCVKGFAIGRTIFGEASYKWLQGKIDDQAFIESVKHNYLKLIDFWLKIKI